MKIIDAHATIGEGRYKKQSAEALLRAMEENGVSQTVVCPPEESISVYNNEGNEFILQVCRANRGKLLGFAVANPWYGQKAVDCLRHYLAEGMNGVFFDSSIQGFSINDHIVDPLIDVCGEFRVPVYFHTGTPAFALPLQLHYLARRHPSVNFIMGHMGANDFVSDVRPAMRGLENLYLETSMNLTCTLEDMLKAYPERIIFGSDAPRSPLAYELSKMKRAGGDPQTLELAFAGNILRILGGSL